MPPWLCKEYRPFAPLDLLVLRTICMRKFVLSHCFSKGQGTCIEVPVDQMCSFGTCETHVNRNMMYDTYEKQEFVGRLSC